MDRKHFFFLAGRDQTRTAWLGKLGMVILLAGTVLAQPAQATHESATEKEVAFRLVLERCYICHYVDRAETKWAPSLKGIYQRQNRTLANGKPINDSTITEIITEGTANMPAFKHTLTPQQIQLILKFLKEGWASEITMLRGAR